MPVGIVFLLIYDAIALGIPLSQIYDITKIDMWYLKQYEELFQLEKEIATYTIDTLDKETCYWKQSKKDMEIAR